MHVLLAAVVALALPPGTTMALQPDRNPIRLSPDGTIAASVTLTDPTEAGRVALWRGGAPRLVAPSSQLDPGENSAELDLAGFDNRAMLYTTLVKNMELEAGGNQSIPERYANDAFAALPLAACADVVQPDFRPYLERVDGESLYLTYESPDSTEVLEGDTTSELAPFAVRLDGSTCMLLGRASLRAQDGDYAAGFRGYLGTFIAPSDLDTDGQRYVAVLMHGGGLTELGPGVALAVNAHGDAAGADAPVDINESSCCTPHAMLWRGGTAVPLAPQARSSVAYAIDERDDVLGTLIGSDGRRYAFLWQNGHLHLLDETAHAAGWHFESAFAFGAHGEIIGAGEYRGKLALFEIG